MRNPKRVLGQDCWGTGWLVDRFRQRISLGTCLLVERFLEGLGTDIEKGAFLLVERTRLLGDRLAGG